MEWCYGNSKNGVRLFGVVISIGSNYAFLEKVNESQTPIQGEDIPELKDSPDAGLGKFLI